MKKPVFPLKTRILLLLLAGVVFFGTINLWLVRYMLVEAIQKSLGGEGRALTQLLAGECVAPAVRLDSLSLKMKIEEFRARYPDMLYAVVYGADGVPRASTLNGDLPGFLLKPAKELNPRKLRTDEIHFQDFSAPIADGNLGWVRLGLSEKRSRRMVFLGQSLIGGMILVFLLFGVLGAWAVAENVHKGAAELVRGMEEFSFERPLPALPVHRKDEIGQVAQSLAVTLERVQALHREHGILMAKFKDADRLTSMGLLASGLAHDINNPLAGLIASIQRLAKNPQDRARIETYLEPMLEAALHIREVVGDLMGFVRRQRYAAEPVSLAETFGKLQLLAGYRLSARTRLEVASASSIPPVFFDPSGLLQVLINIVLNAADAVNESGGTIRVKAMEEERGIRVTVVDDGPGMPPEVLDRVFEPLFSTKAPEQGTGLGLPLSQKMVKDHGGTLTIESASGQGTKVAILLRRAESAT